LNAVKPVDTKRANSAEQQSRQMPRIFLSGMKPVDTRSFNRQNRIPPVQYPVK